MAKKFNLEVYYTLRGVEKVDFHKDVEAMTEHKAKSKALAHYGTSSVNKIKIVS